MTQGTLDSIHQEFLLSFQEANNVLGIFKAFHQRLDALKEIPEEDQKAFDVFLSGLHLACLNREKTVEYTNLTVSLITTILYIIIFMNVRKNMDIYTDISARRKSLVRELIKLLNKSTSKYSNTIGDRFGIKVVSLNNDNIPDLFNIFSYVSEIICNTNRQLRQEFIEFMEKIDDPLVTSVIREILKISFFIPENSYKDYVANPNAQGYRALHFRLQVRL